MAHSPTPAFSLPSHSFLQDKTSENYISFLILANQKKSDIGAMYARCNPLKNAATWVRTPQLIRSAARLPVVS